MKLNYIVSFATVVLNGKEAFDVVLVEFAVVFEAVFVVELVVVFVV